MKPLRYPILLGLVTCLPFCAVTKATAQDIDDDFISYYLPQNVYPIDSDASAVVLYEKNAVIITNEMTDYMQLDRVHRVIKILKANAVSCADVHLYYTMRDNYTNCYIDGINATTYNLEGDQVVKTSVAKSDIYKKKLGKNKYEVSFLLPAVKEGSIIEYSYERVNPLNYSLPTWNIQGDYPKLESVFETTFPPIFECSALEERVVPFKEYSNKTDAEKDNAISYHIAESDYPGHKGLWVRRNIPAIKEEEFGSAIDNAERMDLQLSGIAQEGRIKNINNTWEKFDQELYNDEDLGKQLTAPNNFLNDITATLTKSCTTDIDKAKAIFSYVRSNFTAEDGGCYCAPKRIAKVLEDKAGTEAEINLLLIAMMQNAGLKAAPVVLSTSGNERVTELFPIDKFNYLICAVQIGGDRILLDASGKYNAFNTLPYYCYNGYARLIDKKGTGFMLNPDDITEKERTAVQVINMSDNGMDYNVVEKFGHIQSAELRKKWTDDKKTFKTYLHDEIQGLAGTVSITQSDIENLDNPDTDLVITYSCRVVNKQHNDQYFFNTDFSKFFRENPFKAMKRQLPIEFPYKINSMCSVTMELPKDFEPEEALKPVTITYDDGKMTYKKLSNYDNDLHWLTINTYFITDQTTYPVEDYDTLRLFFDKMIQRENDMMTIKKTKK